MVKATFDTVVSTLPHVKEGRLQAIAVSTKSRAKLAPDVPTIDEEGIKDFNLGAWLGFFAPKGTPESIINKIHTDLNAALEDPEVNKRLAALGSEVVSSASPQAIPGTDDEILINPYGYMYEEITASSLIKINVAGEVLDNPHTDHGVNQAGYVIHSAVHMARHDVGCVIHTHSRAGMAVSCMKSGLLPLTQTAMRFKDIAYHDYESVAIDMDEQSRLVRDLGTQDAMILRNHGLLVASPSIAEAFNAMYWLEMACRAQVDAMSSGAELIIPSQEIVTKTHHLYQPSVRRPFGLMEWPAMLRYLDRRNPGYDE